MKYVKRPVVIEAFRLGHHDVPQWLMDMKNNSKVFPTPDGLKIETLEGVMEAKIGDWVIQGVKGEIYPCKHDIFEETYLPHL